MGVQPEDENRQNQKKPLFYYMVIVCIITLLMNIFLFPSLMRRKVTEVGYNDFLAMIDNGQVVQVQKDVDETLFIAVNGRGEKEMFKTGNWDDPNLTARLVKAGVTFGQVIPQKESALMSFLYQWVLPIGVMILFWHLLSRMMAKRMGGGNAMTFGKSNAKIYAENETGKTFADVAGEEEAKVL